MLTRLWLWESYKDGEMVWKPGPSNLFLKTLDCCTLTAPRLCWQSKQFKTACCILFIKITLLIKVLRCFHRVKQSYFLVERASFRSLNLQAESVRGFNMGRAISTGSLASSTLNKLAVRPLSVQAEILKRLSCSELSLYQPLQNSAKEKSDKASWEEKPRGMSKSYHDLSQASLFPHRKNVLVNMESLPQTVVELVGKPFHQMARSDTESLAGFTKLNK